MENTMNKEKEPIMKKDIISFYMGVQERADEETQEVFPTMLILALMDFGTACSLCVYKKNKSRQMCAQACPKAYAERFVLAQKEVDEEKAVEKYFDGSLSVHRPVY